MGEKSQTISKLSEDELSVILNFIQNSNDRKSFSLVCKQWLRIEGQTRFRIHVRQPDRLPNFLPRFPNLTVFELNGLISDSDLEFLAKVCPNIQELDLTFTSIIWKGSERTEFGDSGLCGLANRCRKLTQVSLRRRMLIGDLGVIRLIKSAPNLTHLNLSLCKSITDQSLEAIGFLNSIIYLNTEACTSITDKGLAFLANGSASKTMKHLVIAGCEKVSDTGISLLKQMCCLEELSFANCGDKVTDAGGLSLAGIKTLKRMNMSRLRNLTDRTIMAIAENCRELVEVDITECTSMSGRGISAFCGHERLEVLMITGTGHASAADLEEIALGCKRLRCLVMDWYLKFGLPSHAIRKIHSRVIQLRLS